MNDQLVAAINKAVKGAVVKEPLRIDTIVPTGSLALDKAIGIGGWPGGRISELYGRESSGKSTLSLKACANAQRMNLNPVYVDIEYSFDDAYAQQLGINTDELIVTQPDSAEDALNIIEASLQNGCRFIVLDSVGAMTPHKDTLDEGEIGDTHVGLHARLMTQAMRRLTPLVAKKDAIVIFTNQMRAKIGGMTSFAGPTTDTPGGWALKHAYSLRIQLARIGKDMDGDTALSATIKAEITKNKVAPPFSKCEFDIAFGKGVDTWSEIVFICIAQGLVKKAGSWMKDADGNNLGQGVDAAKDYLMSIPDKVEIAVKAWYSGIQMEYYR